MPDGRILLIAGRQIALGDGVRWQVYEQAGAQRTPVTSAGVDRDGTIYAATPEGVARVIFEQTGRWRLQPVVSWSVPGHHDKMVIPDATMHETAHRWLWHSLTGAVMSWRPGQPMELLGFSNTIETVFEFNGDVYVSERADGTLARLRHGNSEIVKAEGSLSALTSVVPLGSDRLLVGTYGRGLQVFDGRNVQPFQADEIFSAGERINDLCRTAQGFIAAAVDGFGIVFFRDDGRTVQVLDRLSDSRFGRIRRLIPGNGGVVWALLDGGLLRVQFPARLSNFEAQFGNGLTTAHPHRFGRTLWMLVDGRLYRGVYDQAGRMVRLELDSPTGIFVNAFSSSIGVPIAGTEQGAFVYGAHGWQPFADLPYLRLVSSQSENGRWPYTARNEVGWLKRDGDRLVRASHKSVPGLGATFNKPVMDAAGRSWLELGIGRVAYVWPRKNGELEARIMTVQDGLPPSWPQLFLDDGTLSVNAGERIWRFDEISQRFVASDHFLSMLPGVRKVFGRPGVDPQGRLWVVADGELQMRTRRGERWQLKEVIPAGFAPYFLTFENGGVAWLHAQHRLARFDPDIAVPPPQHLVARFTELSVAKGGRHFFDLDKPVGELPFAQNTLVARFNALGSTYGVPVNFDVRLEGNGPGEWIAVGSTGFTVLDRVKQGHYVLHLRPRQGATTGEEDSISFSIRPPWYRTPFAWFGYIVGAAGIIALIIWLSTLLERRENNRLERLVAERTRELQQSNRQLAEQMDEIRVLTRAIAQSPVALFITSPAGTIEYTNPRGCLLAGRSIAQLAGFDLNRLRPDSVTESTRAEIAATLERGESWSGQLVIEHGDGRCIPVRSTISRIEGQDGRMHHLVLEEDITEWIEAEERRRRLEAQLAQAQKLESIGTLAGGIAHDFNNILTGILGYCELARLNNEQKIDNTAELEQIRAAGRRAKDLVSQILTFSRRNEIARVALDLSRPVEEALRLLRPAIPATIELVQRVESGTVQADASQIHQIVLNLCTNAVHAIGERPGTLTVLLERIDVDEDFAAEIRELQPGSHMHLQVADTGQGMDAVTLERIFDPFFTTKPRGKGTGLGLPIVQGAVISHGGAMRVRSAPGSGTTFDLYFPVVDGPTVERARRAVLAHGGGQEILMVDDESFVVDFVQTLLERQGYRCTCFTDPRAALDAFGEGGTRFSMVITDLTMPNLTGLELIDAIRHSGRHIPVIILTGYGNRSTRERVAEMPDCVLLEKPFNGDVLLQRVGEMLRPAASNPTDRV
jgi:PAS domain S-box-containing protein